MEVKKDLRNTEAAASPQKGDSINDFKSERSYLWFAAAASLQRVAYQRVA
jgi:hypothetical protein